MSTFLEKNTHPMWQFSGPQTKTNPPKWRPQITKKNSPQWFLEKTNTQWWAEKKQTKPELKKKHPIWALRKKTKTKSPSRCLQDPLRDPLGGSRSASSWLRPPRSSEKRPPSASVRFGVFLIGKTSGRKRCLMSFFLVLIKNKDLFF